MKTIAFYSYKGGTGRSLLLANFAKYLSLCNKRVVVLDFDLEAPGLHHKFYKSGNIEENEWKKWQVQQDTAGLLEYLLYYQQTNEAPIQLQSYFVPLHFGKGSKGCYFMPAGDAPTQKYASNVLSVSWKKLFPPSPPSSGIALFLHLKREIEKLFEPDFLLIDSRTGITDIGTIAIDFLPDIAVCLFLSNQENYSGTRLILETLKKLNAQHIVDHQIKPIPVLSRIPNSKSEEHCALQDVKHHLGDIIGNKDPYMLHNESALHVAEELRFGSNKTLCDSILLCDYIELFEVIDHETIKQSRYSNLTKYFPSRQKFITEETYSHTIGKSVLDFIIEAQSAKGGQYVNFEHVEDKKGDSFQALINSIVSCLPEFALQEAEKSKQSQVKKIKFSKKPFEEKGINWDLLDMHMRTGIFHFCAEPYYLTQLRTITSGVIQFGQLKTFTCFVMEDTEMLKSLKGVALDNEIEPRRKFKNAMKFIADKVPKLELGMMGETAATFEASRKIVTFISGKSLSFHKDAEALADWITQKNTNRRMIVCDHSVARMINKSIHHLNVKSAKSYVYAPNGRTKTKKYLVFEFEDSIPTGFLYPNGDMLWRHVINMAFSKVVFNNGELWKKVSKNLRSVGITPMKHEELQRSLLMGMTPDEATEYLKTTTG